MNNNQELATTLLRFVEVCGSALASTARVIANGPDAVVVKPVDGPTQTALDLLVMDLALMQAAVGAVVVLVRKRRGHQQ